MPKYLSNSNAVAVDNRDEDESDHQIGLSESDFNKTKQSFNLFSSLSSPFRTIKFSLFWKNSNKKNKLKYSSVDTRFRDDQLQAGLFGLATSQNNTFIHPVMPNIGETVHIKDLIDRNKNTRKIMEETMSTLLRDVDTKIQAAKAIPVANPGDHVVVTTEIYDLIRAEKTKRENAETLRKNLNEMEQTLILRQSILEAMNTNANSVIVAPLAPLDIGNTRSITITK